MAITDGIELVTGYAGKAHVSSDDIAAFNRGIIGYDVTGAWRVDNSDAVLSTRGTTLLIVPQSDWIVEGRFVRISKSVNVPVPLPPVGYKQQYFLYLVYMKEGSGIETCQIELNSYEGYGKNISNGSAYLLASIQVSTTDISILDQSRFSKKLSNLHDLDYRLTHTTSTTARLPYMDRPVTLRKTGNLVVLSEQVLTSGSGANAHFNASETIPDGYRPAVQGVITCSDNSSTVASLLVNSRGGIEVNGNFSQSRYLQVLGVWVTA